MRRLVQAVDVRLLLTGQAQRHHAVPKLMHQDAFRVVAAVARRAACAGKCEVCGGRVGGGATGREAGAVWLGCLPAADGRRMGIFRTVESKGRKHRAMTVHQRAIQTHDHALAL
jgi:hypothetical protein